MERARRSRPKVTKELPFGGLGHDLSSAEMRAKLIKLVTCLSETKRAACAIPHMEDAPRLSGFALLVALGRETRGR